MKFDLQLFGGSGGGGSAPPVKQSAPGSTAAATIDSATAGERQSIHDKLKKQEVVRQRTRRAAFLAGCRI